MGFSLVTAPMLLLTMPACVDFMRVPSQSVASMDMALPHALSAKRSDGAQILAPILQRERAREPVQICMDVQNPV